MKARNILILGALAMAIASCSATKESSSEESAEAAIVSGPYSGSIAGNWDINEIVLNDSTSIKPFELNSDEPQTVMFTDSTYHFQTNCNLVQGNYTHVGDSISFSQGMSTRMACPDMSVENALVQILPQLKGLAMDNDSILRLSAEGPSTYILLKKINE